MSHPGLCRANFTTACSCADCLPTAQVAAYGACLTGSIRNLRKDLCAKEFQALTKCVHAAVCVCVCVCVCMYRTCSLAMPVPNATPRCVLQVAARRAR